MNNSLLSTAIIAASIGAGIGSLIGYLVGFAACRWYDKKGKKYLE